MRALFLIGFCLLSLAGLPAQANDGSYVFRDGFYWQGASAFTRTLVSVPGSYYYSNGCCYQYPSTSYYSYTAIPVATYVTPAPPAPATPAYGDGWKTEVLKYAAKRDDIALYQYTLKALGINYASPPVVDGGFSASQYSGGNTLYGYSYNSVKDSYGSLDVNTLYQAAARLAQGAQQYGSQATTEHAGLVQQAGDNQARVAEIFARSKAASDVFRATEPQASSKVTTSITGNGSSPAVANAIAANLASADDTPSFVLNVATPLCGACHTGPKAKGGFDVSQWTTLSAKQKEIIGDRILTTDPNKRMPRLTDGTAGSLNTAQLRAFLSH